MRLPAATKLPAKFPAMSGQKSPSIYGQSAPAITLSCKQKNHLVKSCGLSREQIEAMAPAFFCEPGNLITLHLTFDDLQALAIMQALFSFV